MSVDLVKHCVVTEKVSRLIGNNQYTFDVDLRLNKTQIKRFIEELFTIQILSIKTHRLPRKKKRVGAVQGYKTQYKRVLVRLKEGESIDFLQKRGTLPIS